MFTIKKAVISKPVFEKTANYEMTKNTAGWHDEVLKQFFSDVPYIPKDVNVDAVINNVDENTGYAKGSVVVLYNNKSINFPIIINNYNLSPFDIFIDNNDNGIGSVYIPASEEAVKMALSSNSIGNIRDYDSKTTANKGVKTPGGVPLRKASPVGNNSSTEWETDYINKGAGWKEKVTKYDLEKVAVQLKSNPDIANSFIDNTGDLITSIVNLQPTIDVVTNNHKNGVLDIDNVIKAKQAIVAIDSQMLDVNQLKPLESPSLCELRRKSYPSMEDFVESGASAVGRLKATNIGVATPGIYLDFSTNGGENKYDKSKQIFIALDGSAYAVHELMYNEDDKLYGLKIIQDPKAIERAVEMIYDNSNKEIYSDGQLRTGMDKSDKKFTLYKEYNYNSSVRCSENGLIVVTGAGNIYNANMFTGSFLKKKINDSYAYVGDDTVLLPANVLSIQKVSSVTTPEYKMIAGGVRNIYLIPELSTVINKTGMERLSSSDFLSPSEKIQEMYRKAKIPEVKVNTTNGSTVAIKGDAINDISKVAGIDCNSLSPKHAVSILSTIGVGRSDISEILKTASGRMNNPVGERDVSVFGVRSDYINQNVFDGQEKTARLKGLYKEFASTIKRDLIKEASVLNDPEAVDVVLSLNFINEDSVSDYVESLPMMKKVLGKVSQLLVASRMGLTDVDESALKNVMVNLGEVVKDLAGLKTTITKVG